MYWRDDLTTPLTRTYTSSITRLAHMPLKNRRPDARHLRGTRVRARTKGQAKGPSESYIAGCWWCWVLGAGWSVLLPVRVPLLLRVPVPLRLLMFGRVLK